MDNHKKILVIGAGPAGLSVLKALNQLQPKENYQLTCIEKQPDWSGQWNYTWRSTTDRYGQPVHSSMYSQLWTNIPKQAFEFPDYTWKQYFGKPVPSYLPRQVYKGYFMKRFERQGLRKYIQFNCVARNVKFLSINSKFEVHYTNLANNKDTVQNFDYVVVATGHYSYPNLPEIKGIQLFKGKIAHCHELREFNQFKNLNVLVVGGSFSAEDVTIQCYKYGANRVTWGYRKLKVNYNTANLPKNIELIQGVSHFDQNSVYFLNGQKRQIEAIILCTGYIHFYPFMQENLRLVCPSPTVLWPPNLYMSLAWEKNPKLFYVGMGSYALTQLVVDLQGYLIRDIVSGLHIVPDLSKKHPSDLKRQEDMKNMKSLKDGLNSISSYAKELLELTDYPNYDIDKIVEIFHKNMQDRQQNFISYRDARTFKSIYNGEQSCFGKKSWLQMMDVESKNEKQNKKVDQYFEF